MLAKLKRDCNGRFSGGKLMEKCSEIIPDEFFIIQGHGESVTNINQKSSRLKYLTKA